MQTNYECIGRFKAYIAAIKESFNRSTFTILDVFAFSIARFQNALESLRFSSLLAIIHSF